MIDNQYRQFCAELPFSFIFSGPHAVPACSIFSSLGVVNMGKRQVNVLPIEDEDICVCRPPLILFTPFPVALEHGVLGWKGSAKKMAQIDQTPLAFALALVEYGVDHLKKIKFRYKFSFFDRK